MKDVLGEAMDLEGLKRLLLDMQSGAVQCLAIDTATPSQFAHELLNANPYAFLDDAPLEERRARAVAMRGTVPDSILGEAGRLDTAAIEAVREEIWPDIRDEHEFHDLLCQLVAVPAQMLEDSRTRDWGMFFERLTRDGRTTVGECDGAEFAIAAERVEHARLLWPAMRFTQELAMVPASKELIREEVLKKLALGWLGVLGPVTARSLGARLALPPGEIWKALLLLEMSGTILRGRFEGQATTTVTDDGNVEWCERRLLQRIHKRTLGTLRKQVEPVTPAVFMRWLLQWQHVAPQSQLTGELGVLDAIRSLEGFEAPAIEWERSLLAQRVSGYDPRWLDSLCMAGIVGWGRISPHPAFDSAVTGGSKSTARRIVPTSMAPVTFYIREEALWMDLCLQQRQIPEATLQVCLSELANQLRSCLGERGAMFSGDLVRCMGAQSADMQRALWELVAAGLVTADGFDSLRMLIDPKRKSAFARTPMTASKQRNGAGRWSLLCGDSMADTPAQREAQVESACNVLLRRYGIVFRDLLVREDTMPRWRDLLGIFRRMEARGEVRGGRFLSGFGGEQFALPEVVESLREMRRSVHADSEVSVAAADPLNLVGVVVPGERVAALPGKSVTFANGTVPKAIEAPEVLPDEVLLDGLFPMEPALLRQLTEERASV